MYPLRNWLHKVAVRVKNLLDWNFSLTEYKKNVVVFYSVCNMAGHSFES